MFSVIVEALGKIRQFNALNTPARLVVEAGFDTSDLNIGDSVCVSGVCLTLVSKKGSDLEFDLVAETVRRSIFSSMGPGAAVNLERSLRVGDRINGHFVFGHVDGVTKLLAREDDANCIKLIFELPLDLRPYFAQKGSVSISGVSLTVGEVEARSFAVYIVPHTASVTTLGSLKVGGLVNLEVDMLARYVLGARSGD